jgi:hypothetical protein
VAIGSNGATIDGGVDSIVCAGYRLVIQLFSTQIGDLAANLILDYLLRCRDTCVAGVIGAPIEKLTICLYRCIFWH